MTVRLGLRSWSHDYLDLLNRDSNPGTDNPGADIPALLDRLDEIIEEIQQTIDDIDPDDFQEEIDTARIIMASFANLRNRLRGFRPPNPTVRGLPIP